MAILTNSITNIINSGYISALSPTQNSSLVTELVKSASYDSINFSDKAKKLYEISNIDNTITSLLETPSNITQEQSSYLTSLQSFYNITPTTSSLLNLVNIDDIYKSLGISDANKEDIKKLTNELNAYITELSINQLFNTNQTTTSTLFNYNPLLINNLTQDDITRLSNLSLQLNRVIFSSPSKDLASYLDSFNQLYQLNTPSQDELQNIADLTTKRNMLLSSILLNKTPQNYMA